MTVCTDPRCGYPNFRGDADGERYHRDEDHGPYPTPDELSAAVDGDD